MEKKHILIISQYYYPENFRINDIASQWVRRGYKVSVVTGIPNYPAGKFYKGFGIFKKRRETLDGVDIIRLPIIPRGNNPVGLVLNYFSFVVSGFFWMAFTNLRADYAYTYEVSPMTQALVGVWYAKRRKIPHYIYVTDLWPENVEIITGIKNKFIIGSIQKMVDHIYNRSQMIFTSSRSFIDAIKKRNVPEEKIEFWPQYAEDFYKPVERVEGLIPDDGVFNAVFAGNIGKAQGLDVLVDAAEILKGRSCKVRFNIIGDGRYKNELIDNIKRRGVESMFNFIDRQPAERIPEYLAGADALLITLSKSLVFSITIPAKTQSCLALGKPILLSADGEVQDIIKEAKAGLVCDSLDGAGLADNIEKMSRMTEEERRAFSENAIKYSKEHFSREKLLDRMDEYFK